MIGALCAGAAVGAGLWVLARSLRRPSLDEMLTPVLPPPSTGPGTGWAVRSGAAGAKLLGRLGLPAAGVRRDLELCDQDADGYLAEKTTAAAISVLLPPLLLGAVAAAGVEASLPVLAAAALACAAGCWLAPDLSVRAQARERRAELRTATSLLADLVGIGLAGGAGTSGAVHTAAAHGTGWAAEQIRASVRAAGLRRQPVWQGLEELGERTGVRELTELAASMSLAGADGARVRASVAAKASSLRSRETAAADAAAQAATERMSVPVMVLVAGLLVLIGYPAVVHIVTGF